jgi:SAM-dependent methyltransferase
VQHIPVTEAEHRIWPRCRRLAIAWLRDRRQFAAPRVPRTGPICGYTGLFVSVGHPPRWDALCLNCVRREQHQLLWLWVTEGGGDLLAGKRNLHFAPEKVMMRLMRGNPLYETADLRHPGVTHHADITGVALPDAGYDVAIANHVLEHIPDDRGAMRELLRPLRPGGVALLTVPINASRRQTYENPAVAAPAERRAHFSAVDHVRSLLRPGLRRPPGRGRLHGDELPPDSGTGGALRPVARRVAVCCNETVKPLPLRGRAKQ